MTPETLARLSAIYDRAAGMGAAEREAWLAQLAAEDAALAPGLRALRAGARRETADLLDQGPAFAAPEAAADTAFAAGDAVGPYRLLRRLGEGGMGEVWLAERRDGQLRRPVALKLPTLGLRRSVLVQRFARERDILASLQHPNIARLYDAGQADDGQPWLALEYVEGRTITAHCEAERLDLRGRVRLLQQVAQAVQHAHANLVIHRDLKPGNVLVRPDGQAVLLDFGIAKLVEDEGGVAAETELTRVGGRALTLGYAAPEQLSGAPVSTATDVYALGALLHELLAGTRPFTGSRHEVEQAVLSREPAPPRGVPPALAAIALKALRTAPVERYASADALAQDLGRWLSGERVLAQPDRFGRRLWRLARRHRVPLAAAAAVSGAYVIAIGFGAAAVVIAVLAAALAAALWLTRRATAERDRALALAERNAAVNDFLDTLFSSASGALTPEQLLDRGERLVEHAVQGHPEHRAYVLQVLAGCWSGVGQIGRAERLLARAVELARGVGDATLRATLQGQHAVAAAQQGRLDESCAALDALLEQAGDDAGLRAKLHRQRSVLASLKGDGAGALHHAREALRWHRSAPARPRNDEPALLAELAWALLMAGQVDESERCHAEAARQLETLGLGGSARAVALLANWAHARQEMGDLPGALELFDRALRAAAVAAPDTPPGPFVAVNRAYVLARMGRDDEAERAYRLAAAQADSQGEPAIAFSIRMCLVQLLAGQGRAAEAREALAEAEACCTVPVPESSAGAYARQLARALIALADGDHESALALFEAQCQDDDEGAGLVDALLGRAAAFEGLDRLDEAAADATRALAIARRWQGRRPASFRVGLALLALARVRRRQGREAEARDLARQALPALEATLDAAHPALAQARAAAPG